MLKFYLKTALRNLIRFKFYSVISIISLAAAMAVMILIFSWKDYEMSYDKSFRKYDNIYRLIEHETEPVATDLAFNPPVAAEYIKANISGVKETTRVLEIPKGWLIESENVKLTDSWILTADASFFNIFDVKFIDGNMNNPLEQSNSIALSKSLATKLFPGNPLGKIVKIEIYEFVVSTVYEDLPGNVHLKADAIVSFDLWGTFGFNMNSWDQLSFARTYLLLEDNANIESVNSALSGIMQKNSTKKSSLFLQPLKDIHLKSSFTKDYSWGHGNIRNIYLSLIIAFVILISACSNFINLSTAISLSRKKEISLKKISGATRLNIIGQFLAEATFLVSISLIIAIFLVDLGLSHFNSFLDCNLTLPAVLKNSFISILLTFSLTLALGGLYPAFRISSVKPLDSLKGNIAGKINTGSLRKILLILQYIITSFFFFSLFVILSQMRYVADKDLGFDSKNVIYFITRGTFQYDFEKAKTDMLLHPGIESVSMSSSPLEVSSPFSEVEWDGKEETDKSLFREMNIGYNSLEVLDFKLLAGRNLNKDFAGEDLNSVIINEAAAKLIDNPLGKQITINGNKMEIVGIISDFHFASMKSPIEPVILYNSNPIWVFVELKPENQKETISFIRDYYKSSSDNYPFEPQYLEDELREMYKNEEKIVTAMYGSTLLAILISSLGLIGTVRFSLFSKLKEISIRKVLGSTATQIFNNFSVNYLKYIFISNFIGIPLAFYLMSKWLDTFAYRIQISWLEFVLTVFLTLFLSLLVISAQVIKASRVNPVEILKNE